MEFEVSGEQRMRLEAVADDGNSKQKHARDGAGHPAVRRGLGSDGGHCQYRLDQGAGSRFGGDGTVPPPNGETRWTLRAILARYRPAPRRQAGHTKALYEFRHRLEFLPLCA